MYSALNKLYRRFSAAVQNHIKCWLKPSSFTIFRHHAPQIWACDFTQVYDILFRSLFVFVIVEHASRRVVHVAVTSNPSDAWVAQQL